MRGFMSKNSLIASIQSKHKKEQPEPDFEDQDIDSILKELYADEEESDEIPSVSASNAPKSFVDSIRKRLKK